MGHRVPFAGLKEVARSAHAQHITEDNGQHIVANGGDDHRDEDFHTETEGLANGREVKIKRGTPLDEEQST